MGGSMDGQSTPKSSNTPTESDLLLDQAEHGNGNYDSLSSSQDLHQSGDPSNDSFKIKKRPKRSKTLQTFSKRAAYYVPVLDWLPHYCFKMFAGDCMAALTLACLLVPQSMSYASLAKADPISGIYGAAIPSLVYSILGRCRQIGPAPEAALSLITGHVVSDVIEQLPYSPTPLERAKITAATVSTVTFLVGFFTFLLGIFRLGFLDAVLGRPLLRGFVSAIAVVIFVSQLIPMLGLEQYIDAAPDIHTTLDKIVFIIENLGHAHKLTALVSLVSLAVLFFFRIFKPVAAKRFAWISLIPDVLVVVIIGTVLTSIFNWDQDGLSILGHVSTGDVHIHLPFQHSNIDHIKQSIGPAVTISVLGYLDSIVAAKENSSLFNYSISPNRELVALGACNIAGSLISGTIPGYGSITRARLSARAGARTQMSSFLTSIFIFLAAFFLLQYLYYLPTAILASIVCMVVYSIILETPHDLAYFFHMRAWSDLMLTAVTFILTIVWSVEAGITVSVILSLIMVVRKSAEMRIHILGRARDRDEWVPIEPEDDDDDDGISVAEEDAPGVLIVRIKDALHFSNAGALKERLRRLELYGTKPHHPSDEPFRQEASVIVFHLGDVAQFDASALQILYETIEAYVKRGVQVYFVHVGAKARKLFERSQIIDLIGHDHILANVKSALDFFSTRSFPLDATLTPAHTSLNATITPSSNLSS